MKASAYVGVGKMTSLGVVRRILMHLAFIILAVVMSMPFVWMISTAFKTPPELIYWPPSLLPENFQLDNFRQVFASAPFGLYFLNSLGVASISSLAIITTSTVAGYIFAKFRFIGSSLMFSLMLATAIVPFEIYMIPLYMQMNDLQLINTFPGLFMPYLVMSFGIFFMRQNVMQQIPDELIESARVEGASEWRTFGSIVVPQLRSPMSALGIFAFIEGWNAFIWPLLVANEKSHFTMELGLAMFQSNFTIAINVMSAGSVISIIPILVVYLFLRKSIIESVSLTGI
jgi:multiple sugar transport system permease protein